MRKSTYKAIDVTVKALRSLDIAKMTALEKLEGEAEDAREAFENLSDARKESDVGVEENERIVNLEFAIENIKAAAEELRSAIESIEEIEGNAPEGAFD